MVLILEAGAVGTWWVPPPPERHAALLASWKIPAVWGQGAGVGCRETRTIAHPAGFGRWSQIQYVMTSRAPGYVGLWGKPSVASSLCR